MKNKPLILVTNDDGISAPGIRILTEIMSKIGEVWVVAPEKARSGMGHAITIGNILTYDEKEPRDGASREFSCSGTPADCVKLAKNRILPRRPDICVSGINHGSNATINVIYSGTMGAAMEAGVEGIPSIGFSICDHRTDADFGYLEPFIRAITLKALEHGLPKNTVLDVNFPTGPVKGVKICRQADTRWEQEFERRTRPYGGDYFWLVGTPICNDRGTDTDQWALDNGYGSIVPTTFDLTAYGAIEDIENWGL